MAWLRKGDNAATHPLVMALAVSKGADDRLLNEAYGFLQRCGEQSAGHTTDGFIDPGTAMLMGGPTRWEALVAACVEAGLLTRVRKGKTVTWKIVDDADFMHIRSRAELEWERRRRRDAANPDLVVPARTRDGDGCRYCGVIVQWRARRGLRRGTYHHREGRHTSTTTLPMFVVACHGCNLALGDEGLAAETDRPILPPPLAPFYGADTVELLANHGVIVTPSDPARLASEADTARRRPTGAATAAAADSSATPGRGSRTVARRSEPAAGVTDLQIPAGSSRSEVSGPGRDGSGRVGTGSGQVGAGASMSGPAPPSLPVPGAKRRRGRRGGGAGA